jgi:hypothetical protein
MPIRPAYQNVCRPLLWCIAIRSLWNCMLSQFFPPFRDSRKENPALFSARNQFSHSPFSKQYQCSIVIPNVSDFYSGDVQFETLPEHETSWLIFHGFPQPLQVCAGLCHLSIFSCIFNSSIVNHPIIILLCVCVRVCVYVL